MSKVSLFNRFRLLSMGGKVLWIVGLVLLSPILMFLLAIGLYSIGTPVFLVILCGIYVYCAYRYIWGLDHHKVRRFIISVAIFVSLLAFNVIDEYLNPSLPGPFMWAITDTPFDYPSTWGDNWRLWWIGVMLNSSLLFSTGITVVLILARNIGRLIRKDDASQDVQCS